MDIRVRQKRWELLRMVFSSKEIEKLVIKEGEQESTSVSNKIGSFIFAIDSNGMNLLSVSRANKITEIKYMNPGGDLKSSAYFHYSLTDQQHEEFVSKLYDQFPDMIMVKGDII
jgi:hypothetical protein